MSKSIAVIASILTIIGVLVSVYQLGQSNAAEAANENIKISVENSISNVVSDLPQEKKEMAEELLNPLLELVIATLNQKASDSEKNKIEKVTDKIRGNLSTISLVSYKASQSPFVPPINKVQFLCGDRFLLTYMGQYGAINSLRSQIKVNGSPVPIDPGDIKDFDSDQGRLVVTYLEYRKDMKGPVLKYECE
jgi:hypothetical protein